MPPGWEMRKMPSNGVEKLFFIDHTNKSTTWIDPRPPAAINANHGTQQPLQQGQQPQPIPQLQQMMEKIQINKNPPASAPPSHIAPVSTSADQRQLYFDFLSLVIASGRVTAAECRKLEELRAKHGISEQIHIEVLAQLGLTQATFDAKKIADDALPNDSTPTAPQATTVDPNRECVVCMDVEANHIILDCMHICLCGTCAAVYASSKKTECPKCRGHINRIAKTF